MSRTTLPKSFYGMDASPRALKIRRRLTKREALVHEVAVAVCHGWDRPTSISELADRSGFRKGHVSEALTSLEALGVLRRKWSGPKTSAKPSLTIEFLLDLDEIERRLDEREKLDGRRHRSTKSGTGLTNEIGNSAHPQIGNSTVPSSGTEHLIDPDLHPDQNQIPPSVPPSRQPSAHQRASAGTGMDGARLDEELIETVHEVFAALGDHGKRWRNGLPKYLRPILEHEIAPTADEIVCVVRRRVRQANIRVAACPPALALNVDEFVRELQKLRDRRAVRAAETACLRRNAISTLLPGFLPPFAFRLGSMDRSQGPFRAVATATPTAPPRDPEQARVAALAKAGQLRGAALAEELDRLAQVRHSDGR